MCENNKHSDLFLKIEIGSTDGLVMFQKSYM